MTTVRTGRGHQEQWRRPCNWANKLSQLASPYETQSPSGNLERRTAHKTTGGQGGEGDVTSDPPRTETSSMQYFTIDNPTAATGLSNRSGGSSSAERFVLVALAAMAAALLVGFCGLWQFGGYAEKRAREIAVRMSAAPLDTYVNPRSSLAAAGPEFCRLFAGDGGLHSIKCGDGVGFDVVYAGEGACCAVACSSDEWWMPRRWWEVECGGKVIAHIANDRTRPHAR